MEFRGGRVSRVNGMEKGGLYINKSGGRERIILYSIIAAGAIGLLVAANGGVQKFAEAVNGIVSVPVATPPVIQ